MSGRRECWGPGVDEFKLMLKDMGYWARREGRRASEAQETGKMSAHKRTQFTAGLEWDSDKRDGQRSGGWRLSWSVRDTYGRAECQKSINVMQTSIQLRLGMIVFKMSSGPATQCSW